MRILKTIVICLIIAGAGGWAVYTIFQTEPTAQRGGAVRETAMLVEVTEVERGDFQPTIRAMGTVEAAREITLSPRVRGQVVRLAESFTPGGFVDEGEIVVELDDSDYRNALAQRESRLDEAMAELEIEEGRQNVARHDLALMDEAISDTNRSLVLREPQLAAIQSRIDSARAAVRQAELELARTTIRTPFDAHVLRRDANLGSQVSPGESLGRIVGTDAYWVVASVPQAKLRWLRFADEDERASRVRVFNRSAWDEGTYREGRLLRLVGALEESTRMARVLIDVTDPLSIAEESRDVPPLILGSFVEVELRGAELPDVVRVPRELVRQDATVWVMDSGELAIRTIEIAVEDAAYAYVSSGLESNAKVVTTNLATVVEGAPLRLEGEAAARSGGEAEGTEAGAGSGSNSEGSGAAGSP